MNIAFLTKGNYDEQVIYKDLSSFSNDTHIVLNISGYHDFNTIVESMAERLGLPIVKLHKKEFYQYQIDKEFVYA